MLLSVLFDIQETFGLSSELTAFEESENGSYGQDVIEGELFFVELK